MCRSYQCIYEALVKDETSSSDTAMAVEGQPEWVPVSVFWLLLLRRCCVGLYLLDDIFEESLSSVSLLILAIILYLLGMGWCLRF